MIFSELYSAYYQAVAAILREACARPVKKAEIRGIIGRYAFGESVLNIEPALFEGRWQLLHADGTTPILHAPSMPLTTLQKRWLNAVALDPRIRLFTDDPPFFPDVAPLFTQEDITVFDRYLDGDPYGDEGYIQNFRTVLDAVRTKTPLSIESRNRKGAALRGVMVPGYLEYSEKDDKFRLIGAGLRGGSTVNLGRIIRCEPVSEEFRSRQDPVKQPEHRTVVLEVANRRNALERVLMHFAHFEKEAERLDPDRYRVSITYDKEDETEMVIRILSFGPMVRVTAPGHFQNLIRDRLISQKSCGR